jgi:hypothetical protein
MVAKSAKYFITDAEICPSSFHSNYTQTLSSRLSRNLRNRNSINAELTGACVRGRHSGIVDKIVFCYDKIERKLS